MTLIDYMQNAFDDLHQLAEPSFHEHKTAAYITKKLKELGYEDIQTNVNGTTGVIATLDSGVAGPVLGYRAELDALVYEIDGQTEYRHACGHDGHMAVALGIAKAAIEDGINKGKLKLIFQPAEETLNGAVTLIENNQLDDLTHIIGMHIRTAEDCALNQACAGIRHSAAAPTRVRVRGKAAHASRPHLGQNAVEAAAFITLAVNAIKLSPNESYSAKVTQINTGGGSGNVIPDHVDMYIDVRSETNQTMTQLLEKLKTAIQNAAQINGCQADISTTSCPAAEYDDDLLAITAQAIQAELGADALVPDFRNPGSDDFHHYAQEIDGIKAAFVGMGANATPGLHDKNMTFDREAINNGQRVMYHVVKQLLN